MSNLVQLFIIIAIIILIMICATVAAIILEYIAQFLPGNLANIEPLFTLAFGFLYKL